MVYPITRQKHVACNLKNIHCIVNVLVELLLIAKLCFDKVMLNMYLAQSFQYPKQY